MSTKSRSAPSVKRPKKCVQKARGVLHPRVQQVGPDHFGVVCVDCAKIRSKWMACDFYGNILVPPSVLTHARGDLQTAMCRLVEARERHQLRDVVAAIERNR